MLLGKLRPALRTMVTTTKKRLQRSEPHLRVRLVPMFDDNYGYLVIDEANQHVLAVDPAQADVMAPVLAEELAINNREMLAVLTTHGHPDHCGGNETFAAKYPGITITGPHNEAIPAMTTPLKGGEEFKLGAMDIQALAVPCHTKGHLAYVVSGDPETPPLLFPGDTLFVGGCGKFFEGTAEDMYHALYEVILQLPKETKVYCGHEYTMSNLRFALSVDPTNAVLREKIAWAKLRRSKNLPTIPSTLREEMLFNPFLRVHDEVIRNAVGGNDPITVLSNLRRKKDSFI
ncbi:hydroxyacylglutathione hydrolase [Saprolegnia parasitica CBS 223.65]|uniref:hydroxyacylglutathione hydrolase n=1 Tax=Saprolegnia parasitica (strain CBS 223.65) TaxID=695850 RepID=A0A067C0J7_SAPPC|nr:hydroxyacylglutathione hydrolase [Saprolegnia parasitica CBS 223.65]KDO20332.1 hydroxyacylglutathione hydrolase [Saprolegnia parasitica CBS 223.65]|eukprot:XP_012208930.1 hydroxyacylglutathione hydrolase [Saprolegnia parasitica CBS 223.65]